MKTHRAATFGQVGALLVIIFAAGNATAQSIAPDDPAVLLGFFGLEHAIDQAAVSDRSLRASAASVMGISEAEFTVVSQVADSVLAGVGSITMDAVGHRDPLVERQFETRRCSILLAALDMLHQRLSAEGWEAVHGYINGRYRASLRIRGIAAR